MYFRLIAQFLSIRVYAPKKDNVPKDGGKNGVKVA